jgi:uncharacterized protein YbjT (DUF2867 family)
MTVSGKTILVTGATGAQGGSLIRALKGGPFALRGMTRKPNGEKALALKRDGIEIVEGDLDDEASLARALQGVWGVYAVQNTWEAGVEKEEVQGKRMAAVAKRAGVQHFVYASVASAHRGTGIPHFENKWRVEDSVRNAGFPSSVIVRPVFFMENLTTPWFLNGDRLATALGPETKLQMIAVDDVGRFAARAFHDAARLNGREIDIAGDSRTMTETAAILSRALGRTVAFTPVPIDEIRKNSVDYALMLDWFEGIGYDADIPALKREFGFSPLTLEQWAQRLTP